MSQYLSHLANLAFNHVDVVQPRLASRFEHQDGALAPNLMEQQVQQDVSFAQPHQDHQEPVPPERLSQPSQPALQPIVENIYPTEIRIQEAPTPKPQSIRAQESIAPAATRTPTPAPVAPAVISTNTIVERHIERTIVATPHASGVLGETPLSNQGYRQTQPAAINEAAAPLAASEDKLEPQTSEKSGAPSDPVKPVSIRVQPVHIERLATPAAAYPSMPHAEVVVTPAPSIQVTIGRIEIRASQTNSPAPAKPRASGGMSLDDYLKQRNGDKP